MSSYVQKLIIHIFSTKATKGGFARSLEYLRDDGLRNLTMLQAKMEVESYISAVRESRDNPYGNDDESIAKAIWEKIQEREKNPPRATT